MCKFNKHISNWIKHNPLDIQTHTNTQIHIRYNENYNLVKTKGNRRKKKRQRAKQNPNNHITENVREIKNKQIFVHMMIAFLVLFFAKCSDLFLLWIVYVWFASCCYWSSLCIFCCLSLHFEHLCCFLNWVKITAIRPFNHFVCVCILSLSLSLYSFLSSSLALNLYDRKCQSAANFSK